jgi:hypothetical protein
MACASLFTSDEQGAPGAARATFAMGVPFGVDLGGAAVFKDADAVTRLAG